MFNLSMNILFILVFFVIIIKCDYEDQDQFKNVEQYLDHFNTLDNRTFNMKYLTVDKYFKPNGPIFLYLSDDIKYASRVVEQSHLQQLAEKNGAYIVATEMRFSSSSLPENYEHPNVLKHLTIEQKLEDILHLIKTIKKNSSAISQCRVIVFGCRFNGNLATWLRDKYPHIVYGAVASDAGVNTKPVLCEELEDLGLRIKAQDPKCFDIINKGIKETLVAVRSNDSSRVSEAFKFCTPQSLIFEDFTSNIIDLASMMKYFMAKTEDIITECQNIRNASGSPMDKLGVFGVHLNPDVFCHSPTTLKEKLLWLTSDSPHLIQERMLTYSICTQYGQFPVSDKPEYLFSDSIPLSYYTEHFCPTLFGNEFRGDKLISSYNRVNEKYGGDNPNVTRVLFIYGRRNQFHWAGVKENFVAEFSDVLHVEDEVTCLRFKQSNDDKEIVKNQKNMINQKINNWLQ